MACGLPSVIAPRLGGSPTCVATCQKLCSDIIELDTRVTCRQRKISIKPGHRLENTKSWDLTGICSPMMTGLLTEILTVKTYCMDILLLFAVEGSLVPALHVIFAEILCLSS